MDGGIFNSLQESRKSGTISEPDIQSPPRTGIRRVLPIRSHRSYVRSFRRKVQKFAITSSILVVLWFSWFAYQVQLRGEEATREAYLRLSIAAGSTAIALSTTWIFLQQWFVACSDWGSLLLPFFMDSIFWGVNLWTGLPMRAQASIVIGALLIVLLQVWEPARHIMFTPIGVGLWWVHQSAFPDTAKYIPSYLMALVVPISLSLRAFRRNYEYKCGFWLMYWTVLPLYLMIHDFLLDTVGLTGVILEYYWSTVFVMLVWVELWNGCRYAFFIYNMFDIGRLAKFLWSVVMQTPILKNTVGTVASFIWRMNPLMLSLRLAGHIRETSSRFGNVIAFAFYGFPVLMILGVVGWLILTVYNFFSAVLEVVVWSWFFIESGNVITQKINSEYRRRLAISMVFLVAQHTLVYVPIPAFFKKLVHLPMFATLNMVGDALLDSVITLVLTTTKAGWNQMKSSRPRPPTLEGSSDSSITEFTEGSDGSERPHTTPHRELRRTASETPADAGGMFGGRFWKRSESRLSRPSVDTLRSPGRQSSGSISKRTFESVEPQDDAGDENENENENNVENNDDGVNEVNADKLLSKETFESLAAEDEEQEDGDGHDDKDSSKAASPSSKDISSPKGSPSSKDASKETISKESLEKDSAGGSKDVDDEGLETEQVSKDDKNENEVEDQPIVEESIPTSSRGLQNECSADSGLKKEDMRSRPPSVAKSPSKSAASSPSKSVGSPSKKSPSTLKSSPKPKDKDV